MSSRFRCYRLTLAQSTQPCQIIWPQMKCLACEGQDRVHGAPTVHARSFHRMGQWRQPNNSAAPLHGMSCSHNTLRHSLCPQTTTPLGILINGSSRCATSCRQSAVLPHACADTAQDGQDHECLRRPVKSPPQICVTPTTTTQNCVTPNIPTQNCLTPTTPTQNCPTPTTPTQNCVINHDARG